MSNKPIQKTLGIKQCDAELRQKIRDKSKDPFELESVEDIKAHRLTITHNAKSLKEQYTKEFGPENYLDEEILTLDDGHGFKIELSIFIPKGKEIPEGGGRPCFYYIHGGGFVTCNRYSGLESLFACIEECNAVCVTVEYGLAPETDALRQLHHCSEGLQAFLEKAKNPKNYGLINLEKVAVVGRSAGAAFLPGVCIKDYGNFTVNQKFKVKCALMSFPMLDNRYDSPSYHRFKDAPFLPQKTAKFCWEQRLTGHKHTQDELKLIVPVHLNIEDMKEFPPTLIEVAKSDVLSSDGQCFFFKLRVAGREKKFKRYKAFHCFDEVAPESSLAEVAKKNRVNYFRSQGLSEFEVDVDSDKTLVEIDDVDSDDTLV